MRRICVAFVGTVLAMVGCSVDPNTAPEGLTVLSRDPSQGIVGVYVHQGTAVLFESVRTAEYAVRDNGNAGPEIAVRVTDAEGRTLALRLDGHLPPHWSLESGPDSAPSAAVLEAAERALDELKQVGFGAAAAPELAAFASLTPAVRDMTESLRQSPASATGGEIPYSRIYRQWIGLYRKCLVACAGYHSSTRVLRQYSDDGGASWATSVTQDRCNHGDCLQSLGYSPYMGCAGPTKSADASVYLLSGAFCSTSYNFASVDNSHNCNDDTEYQMAMVLANQRFGDQHHDCDNGASHNVPPGGCSVDLGWY